MTSNELLGEKCVIFAVTESKRDKASCMTRIMELLCRDEHACLYVVRYNMHLMLRSINNHLLNRLVVYEYTDELDLLQLLLDYRVENYKVIIVELTPFTALPTEVTHLMEALLGAGLRALSGRGATILCIAESSKSLFFSVLSSWAHKVIECNELGEFSAHGRGDPHSHSTRTNS